MRRRWPRELCDQWDFIQWWLPMNWRGILQSKGIRIFIWFWSRLIRHLTNCTQKEHFISLAVHYCCPRSLHIMVLIVMVPSVYIHWTAFHSHKARICYFNYVPLLLFIHPWWSIQVNGRRRNWKWCAGEYQWFGGCGFPQDNGHGFAICNLLFMCIRRRFKRWIELIMNY